MIVGILSHIIILFFFHGPVSKIILLKHKDFLKMLELARGAIGKTYVLLLSVI